MTKRQAWIAERLVLGGIIPVAAKNPLAATGSGRGILGNLSMVVWIAFYGAAYRR